MGDNKLLCSLLLFLFLLSCVNAEDPYRFFTWKVTYGDIYPLGAMTSVSWQKRRHYHNASNSSSATPPYASSPKLESRDVNQSMDPSTEQKRRHCQKANGVVAEWETVAMGRRWTLKKKSN
uniref:Uncharacterized protein n=1 Tax=Nelumbo nucifera TaxID=4432 RepID=A0A822XLB4_NELNU|nr:TPA_asm: hypothetical protein HUJ06_021966 [Nelumbo nucifera]